jgi:hypothetical protein
VYFGGCVGVSVAWCSFAFACFSFFLDRTLGLSCSICICLLSTFVEFVNSLFFLSVLYTVWLCALLWLGVVCEFLTVR